MSSLLLWSLIAVQMALGAFDTLYHHELTERLAWRPSQRRELMLHGMRNLAYAVLFAVLGWAEVRGVLAMALLVLLAAELIITLMDFVEEDRSRKLPASERVTHTLLALNYGAILVLGAPVLVDWAGQATGVVAASLNQSDSFFSLPTKLAWTCDPVRMRPGQTVVTRIPLWRSSAWRPSERPTRANLDAV